MADYKKANDAAAKRKYSSRRAVSACPADRTGRSANAIVFVVSPVDRGAHGLCPGISLFRLSRSTRSTQLQAFARLGGKQSLGRWLSEELLVMAGEAAHVGNAGRQ